MSALKLSQIDTFVIEIQACNLVVYFASRYTSVVKYTKDM